MIELSLYMIIAIVCGLMLIVMAILGADFLHLDVDSGVDHDVDVGGHFEAGHGDFATGLSPLSLPIVLSFGTSFGAFGVIFDSMDVNAYLVPVLSTIVSAVISTILFFAMVKLFVKTQATTRVNFGELLGKEAVVSIPIKPGEQGQVMLVTEARGRTLISAIADEEIPSDSIVVIEKMTGNTAIVKKKEGLVD